MTFLNEISILYILTDYFISFLMWLLIFRFLLNIFFSNETQIKLIKLLFDFTNKFINLFNKIIPSFLPYQLIPIYLAWILFMIRFYFLPLTLDYNAVGYFSLILEKDIYEIFSKKLFF